MTLLSGRRNSQHRTWLRQEFRLQGSALVRAYQKFGKGRHEAALNYGDCLSYAVASLAGQPLLCIGKDFELTDLEIVSL